MNRERAETYLRLLAEANLTAKDTWQTLRVAALALTAVDALDEQVAEAILADYDLAVSVRHTRPQQDPAPGWPSGPVLRAVAGRIRSFSPMTAGPPAPFWPGAGRRYPRATVRPQPALAAPGPDPGADPVAEHFVMIGQTVPFPDAVILDGVYLMAYARTAAGARFTAGWQTHLLRPDTGLPPFELCTVTDDRGRRYQMDFTGDSAGPRWTGLVTLYPDPPADVRWFEISAPDGPAVRVELVPTDVAAAVEDADVGPGEHLLTLIAERMLATAPDFPHDPRRDLVSPGLTSLATGLGEVVAALEAAELLPPLSPLPGWLATLCVNLRVNVPGLTAPPALDLPDQWLSLLAHHHRRKPGSAPAREGYAATAGALPEVDGVRLAFLGLENTEGQSWLHVLARGMTRQARHGPCGIDMDFPLSVWAADSGGRWHLARLAGRHSDDGEDVLRLRLTPPLPSSAAWIEVLAAGRSARARARLPLRWGQPV
jgi:hypothetical protein